MHGDQESKLSIAAIASSLKVPQPFLGKILQQLSRHKIISSTKGPGGGFYLSKENCQKHLLDIVEIVDGTDVFDDCILGLPNCSSINPCPLHEKFTVCRESTLGLLRENTIGQLVEDIKSGNKILRL